MDLRPYTCCFTGHRRFRPGEAAVVQSRLNTILETLITGQGVRYFGAGGALGFDTMAAETVLRFKDRFPWIRLILVLPCPQQHALWRADDAAVLRRHQALSDRTIYVSPRYDEDCMHRRNRRLVDGSGWCVSYQYAHWGGTAYTVSYAREQGLTVLNCLAPQPLEAPSLPLCLSGQGSARTQDTSAWRAEPSDR